MRPLASPESPSSLSLVGKTALITGGTKGIGAGIATAMARAGAEVLITGRDEAAAQAVLAQISALGTKGRFLEGDLADDRVVDTLIARSIEQLGQLDILVNNAGVGPEKPALEITLDDWRSCLRMDLEVPFRLSQAAARHFVSRGDGVIINISSIRGQSAAPDEAHYIAAKHGLNGLTKALAREWAGLGVRVNAIAPGLIFTEMTQHWQDDVLTQAVARYPIGRGGLPRDIGGVAVFLASEAADFLHGQIIAVDGGRTTG